MLFYTIDGNFQASQKYKPMDETDYPLTTGAGSYADERDYEIYRKQLGPPKKEVRASHAYPVYTTLTLFIADHLPQVWCYGVLALQGKGQRRGRSLLRKTYVHSSLRHRRHHWRGAVCLASRSCASRH